MSPFKCSGAVYISFWTRLRAALCWHKWFLTLSTHTCQQTSSSPSLGPLAMMKKTLFLASTTNLLHIWSFTDNSACTKCSVLYGHTLGKEGMTQFTDSIPGIWNTNTLLEKDHAWSVGVHRKIQAFNHPHMQTKVQTTLYCSTNFKTAGVSNTQNKQEHHTVMVHTTRSGVWQAVISIWRPESTTHISEQALCAQERAVSKHIESDLCMSRTRTGTLHSREMWWHALWGLVDRNIAYHTRYICTGVL